MHDELTANKTNPFSTRLVRPGAIEFVFAPGPKAPQLVDRLFDTGGWGQIVGPHGSGKTALVHTLLPHLKRARISASVFTMAERQRQMPAGWLDAVADTEEPGAACLVIVDGYERLGRLARIRLQRICRRRRWGLLATVHESVGLPLLYRTRPSVEIAIQLTAALLADHPTFLSEDLVRNSFEEHRGNLRDMFFDLYDHYERYKARDR